MRTIILAMALVATTASAQPICTTTIQVPCDILSSEIHPAVNGQVRWWDDGTVLTESSGLTAPVIELNVALVVGGVPLSFSIKTERRVRYASSAGGVCQGVSTRGWEDPGTVVVQGRQLDVNRPSYLCTEPARSVLCFGVKGDVQPPPPGSPYPLSRIEELCEVLG